jgi:hypothetical protein
MATHNFIGHSRFSTDDDQWPLVAALTWIATRSLKFTEAFASRDVADADQLLWLARMEGDLLRGQNYGEAFHDLCRNIAASKIRGKADRLKWTVPLEHEAIEPAQYFSLALALEVSEAREFRPQDLKNRMIGGEPPLHLQDFVFHDDCLTPKGSGYGSPNPDGSRVRWSWRSASFARHDLLALWPEWHWFTAWKQAKSLPWSPPKVFSLDWLNRFASEQYVPIAEVVNFLAFGAGLMPVGVDPFEAHVMRLRAGLAVFSAAAKDKVAIFGFATGRLPRFPGGLVPFGTFWKIEPADLADMTLVIDGSPDWIGPRKFADEFPERGHALESVKFAGAAVHRASLSRWLGELSNKPAPQKRGRKRAYDWPAIEAEAVRLMNYHGEFSPDDPEWNSQVRLESELLEFCSLKWNTEPSMTQLRTYLRDWLSIWRKTK